jgi:pyruvate,water dikinase
MTFDLCNLSPIVARENGILDVVGVDRATDRLETGDLIRVDGSTGLIQKINLDS